MKFVINSVLSCKGAQFTIFHIGNLYLNTPMEKPEYVKIKFSKISQEFIDEYDLK